MFDVADVMIVCTWVVLALFFLARCLLGGPPGPPGPPGTLPFPPGCRPGRRSRGHPRQVCKPRR